MSRASLFLPLNFFFLFLTCWITFQSILENTSSTCYWRMLWCQLHTQLLDFTTSLVLHMQELVAVSLSQYCKKKKPSSLLPWIRTPLKRMNSKSWKASSTMINCNTRKEISVAIEVNFVI